MHRQNTEVNRSPKRMLKHPATTSDKYITLPVIWEMQNKTRPGDTACLQMGKHAETFQKDMKEHSINAGVCGMKEADSPLRLLAFLMPLLQRTQS